MGSQARSTYDVYQHGACIAPIAEAARLLLQTKDLHAQPKQLSKTEKAAFETLITTLETPKVRDGVNFSRAHTGMLLRARDKGEIIEFETLGPYLADYLPWDGVMQPENLRQEDMIGIELARLMRRIFPKGRLVSLYDEYNTTRYGTLSQGSNKRNFGDTLKANFRQSLIDLFAYYNIISSPTAGSEEFLLIAESQKANDAEKMVAKLEARGYIHRQDQEIMFENEFAESPLYRQIRLRTKTGKWLCEALDAAAFFTQPNLEITHIVILPVYMKAQQDRVWELLRVLGMQPERYHNIFFDPSLSPRSVIRTVREAFIV